MLLTKTRQVIRIIRSLYVQTKLKESIKLLKNQSTHGRQYTTRTSEEKNEREENSRETVEDPDFDEYYDIEEKDKDKDEDEESETNFNKKASTYARTQASSPIGKPEQQRSCSENRPEHFLPRDWKDSSGASEDNCDVRNDENIMYIVVYCIFLILQSYLWWFFASFIYNYE